MAFFGVVLLGSFGLGIGEEESGVGVGGWERGSGKGTSGDGVAIDSQESSIVCKEGSNVETTSSNHDLVVVILHIGDHSVVG